MLPASRDDRMRTDDVSVTRQGLPANHRGLSPRKGIALALINAQVEEGAEVSVDVRGREEVFVVTRPPFVQPGVRED